MWDEEVTLLKNLGFISYVCVMKFWVLYWLDYTSSEKKMETQIADTET
jgi:hypothetical protein